MMKYLTIFLAIIGLIYGGMTVMKSRFTPPDPPLQAPPSINPFEYGISATGLIEASTRNISIAAPEPGLVAKVFIQPNQLVKRGEALFQLDTRPVESQLLTAEAQLTVANAKLARLKAPPREEDIAPLREALQRVEVQLSNARDNYKRAEDAHTARAATDRELNRARFTVEGSEAVVAEAAAMLTRAEAGAWEQDIAIGKAEVASAEAQVSALRIQLERMTVRSPVDGTVLKSNIQEGEFTASSPATSAMVVGDLTTLHIRALVDELDAPMVTFGVSGVARVRGASLPDVPLEMIRIEPLAQPKRQFTGNPTEFVDTRVIEVIFKVQPIEDVRLYPGQLVDVYIESRSADAPPAP